jgi:serpin B
MARLASDRRKTEFQYSDGGPMNGRNISAADFRGGLMALLLCFLCSGSRAYAATEDLVSANSGFAFNLLQQLVSEQAGSNIFISPYSASTALQMVASGAAGTTLAQMQQVLGTSDIRPAALAKADKEVFNLINARNTNFVLSTANAVWFRDGFPIEQSFLEGNEDYFGATVGGLDFSQRAAVNVINGWAAEKTQGKIDQIVSYPMDPSIQLLLANAVYFHGAWQYQFDTNLTADDAFFLPGGAQESVPMMKQSGYYDYYATDSFQAVRLPYQGSNIAMYVFLPSPNSSIAELLGAMSGPWWQQTLSTDFYLQEGTISLPKFNLNYAVTLNEPLEVLGMTDAFTPGADFSGISGVPIFISTVLQQAVVEVNEEGTVAAAVTTITGITAVASGQQPFQMIVNHPFLFVIEDRQAGTILFMGVVVSP